MNITHYLVFKEQNLRENNLSKPSKISISSQLKSFGNIRPFLRETVVTGGAWLSSARVVRCLVKSNNERNPFPKLLTVR